MTKYPDLNSFGKGLVLFSLLLMSCQAQKPDSQTASAKVEPEKTSMTESGVEDSYAGRLTGRVVYKGVVPDAQRLLVVKDVEVCSRVEHHDDRLSIGKGNGIQDAVISLMNVKGGRSMEKLGTEFVLDQRNCAYSPHVLLAPVNTPIRILNDDGILHNIHTFGKKNRPVNLAQPKSTEELQLTFKRPERVPVKCDVHGWMSAWIVVVDNPYYVVTDSEGKFTLDGIPAGTYTVTCWQESLGEQSAQVEIEEEVPVTLEFQYPVHHRDSG